MQSAIQDNPKLPHSVNLWCNGIMGLPTILESDHLYTSPLTTTLSLKPQCTYRDARRFFQCPVVHCHWRAAVSSPSLTSLSNLRTYAMCALLFEFLHTQHSLLYCILFARRHSNVCPQFQLIHSPKFAFSQSSIAWLAASSIIARHI